jgi:hypothetical protein
MEGERERVLETVTEPDRIQRGDFGELLAVRHYDTTSLGDKYVVAVYREVGKEDGFILTAYLARRPSSRRELVWRR